MKPFRKNVAVAIDGGGIKGVIVTCALAMLEKELGKPCYEVFDLAVGTSTGSIISAGIGASISATDMFKLYIDLGQVVFPRTLRSALWPLTRYRYSQEPLVAQLEKSFGGLKMKDFWKEPNRTDVVITTFDLETNHTRFVKPYKMEYGDWPVTLAVRASCTVPTYFPVVEGKYVDGGVGAYANPCYLAAYEAAYCLNWDPRETTLLSFGTGREPYHWSSRQAPRMWAWQWLGPVLGAFLQSADEQQVNLVKTFFKDLDFRRYQVDLRQPIEMDDASKMSELSAYGEEMGRMVVSDILDKSLQVIAERPKTVEVPQKAG